MAASSVVCCLLCNMWPSDYPNKYQPCHTSDANAYLWLSRVLGIACLALGILECVECTTTTSSYLKFSAITDTIVGSIVLLVPCIAECKYRFERSKMVFQHLETSPFAPPQTTSTEYV